MPSPAVEAFCKALLDGARLYATAIAEVDRMSPEELAELRAAFAAVDTTDLELLMLRAGLWDSFLGAEAEKWQGSLMDLMRSITSDHGEESDG